MYEGLQRLELSDTRKISELLGFEGGHVDVDGWGNADTEMRAAAFRTKRGESAYIRLLIKETEDEVAVRTKDKNGVTHSIEPCVDGGVLVKGHPLPVDLPIPSAAERGVVTAKIDPVQQPKQTDEIRSASRELAAAIFAEIDLRIVGSGAVNSPGSIADRFGLG